MTKAAKSEPENVPAVQTTAHALVPDYLKGATAQMPADNFDSSDVVVPRLVLLQGTSPECTAYAEAQSGNFWHTGMDRSFGDSIRFVVVRRRKLYLLLAPMDDGQGLLARADDAKTWDRLGSWKIKVDKKTIVDWTIDELDVVKSRLTEWGTSDPSDSDSVPAATLIYEYVVLLPDYPELGLCIVSLRGAMIKRAKKGLNDKIAMHKNNNVPYHALLFKAGRAPAQNPAGKEYWAWSFTGDGFADATTYERAVTADKNLGGIKFRSDDDMADPVDMASRGVASDDEGIEY